MDQTPSFTVDAIYKHLSDTGTMIWFFAFKTDGVFENMHGIKESESGAVGTRGVALDPICGMTVNPEAAAGSFEYDGRTYYFCSIHCLNKFKADPQGFLNRAQPSNVRPVNIQVEPTGTRSRDSELYTCPMHSEVRQNKPGSCPKCGMALELVTPQKPAEKIEYTCPMHPQIVRDKPGNCPICGMTLEPRTVTLAEEKNPELAEMTRRFWVGVVLTVPLLLIAMSDLVPGNPLERIVSMRSLGRIQFALATASRTITALGD